MKSVVIFGIGLAIGAAVVGGLMALRREGAVEEKSPPPSDRVLLERANDALEKATRRLDALEKKNADLAERLARAQQERSPGKAEPPAVAPQPVPSETAPSETAPADKGAIDIRKLAKSILKMIKIEKEMKGHDWTKLTPEQQREMLAVQANLMAFLAKARFNMQNPYEMFANPESRQMVVDLSMALLEDVGVAGDRGKIDALLAKLGEGAKIQEDPSLSDLGKVVEGIRLQARLAPEVENLFSAQDRETIRRELSDDVLNGLMNLGGGMARGRGSSSSSTSDRSSATESVAHDWSRELGLEDSEQRIVQPVAERYVNEYALLRQTIEMEEGKEFADLYFDRSNRGAIVAFDGKSAEEVANLEKERKEAWEKDREMKSRPEYRAKKTAADLKFWELQLKYQNELKNTLGAEKAEAIKGMRPVMRHFSNLE